MNPVNLKIGDKVHCYGRDITITTSEMLAACWREDTKELLRLSGLSEDEVMKAKSKYMKTMQ